MTKWLGVCLLVCLLVTPAVRATDFNRQNVIVRQKIVEYDPRYYLGLDGYYSVGQKIQADEQSATLNDISSKLDVLIQLLSRGQNLPTPVEPLKPKEPTQPENPTTPENPDGLEPTALDINVYNIFSTNCASCHNENKKGGGLQLVNAANKSLIYQDLVTRVLIEKAVFSGKMPLSGKKLSDKDVDTLKKWMQEEAEILKKEEKAVK